MTKQEIIFEQVRKLNQGDEINITTKDIQYFEGNFDYFDFNFEGTLFLKTRDGIRSISFDNIQAIF